MKKVIGVAFIGMVFSGFVGTAQAISYDFSGTFTDVTHLDMGHEVLPVSTGDNFYGSLTYNYSPGTIANYWGGYAGYNILEYKIFFGDFVVRGGYDGLATFLYIINDDDYYGNTVDVFSYLDEAPIAVCQGRDIGVADNVEFSFVDSTYSVFSNTSLPQTLDLFLFDTLFLSFECYDYADYAVNFSGIIESFTVAHTPVPEPSTLLLFSGGLFFILCSGRFFKKCIHFEGVIKN